MACRRISTLVLVSLSIGCQRLEIADDGGSGLTFSDTTGSTGADGSSSGGGESNGESNDTSPPAFDCDPVLQTGCAGAEKCTAVISSGKVTYVCATDTGELDPFDACQAEIGSGVDGCPAGYVCIADDYDAGACEPLCLTSNDCTDAVCINEPLHHLAYCATACSPFEGGCPPPTQCRRTDDCFACSFSQGEDVGGQGEPCTPVNDAGCSEGFICLAGALIPDCTADSCCTAVCDLVEDTCATPSTCTSIFGAPAPGAENIGACFVPS